MTTMNKIDRRNELAKMFDRFIGNKLTAAKALPIMEFLGQHTSAERQRRKKYMLEHDIKTGKAYRRHLKKLRRG